jgi:hydrogenase expression/formation protein HypE
VLLISITSHRGWISKDNLMDIEKNTAFMNAAVCPLPINPVERVVLGHGSGGKLTHDLIQHVFLPRFSNPALAAGNDAAVVLGQTGTALAISTDCHVVKPLFFPGGDIGRLAVCGTVNDVSMMGAVPLYLSAGFILEEGVEISLLEKIADSMHQAAEEAGVFIIAGDTKVVEKGSGDQIYINTTGIGLVRPGCQVSGSRATPGDVVIASGPIGDHGIAVLAARGELGLNVDVESDCAPLNTLVDRMMKYSDQIHVMRDLTRGGLATSLNEIAGQSDVAIHIEERMIEVRPAVQAACEILGFDPLYLANEGKLVAIVSPDKAAEILMSMRSHPLGLEARSIGTVSSGPAGRVLLRTEYGTTRVVDVLTGEMLPRIC